jgi:7-carboxy-7-deazaguanine synthase (Cx14CxxC type)
MAYSIKEIFLTLQGEGAQAGRRAVFVRFSGCNLWSGREVDRASAICRFCDTDFVGTDGPGGGRYETPFELVQAILEAWGGAGARPFVVFTGGEPLLQIDPALIQVVAAQGIETALETNGTIAVPEGIDWLTVSPKVGSELTQKQGDELKLVWPQEVDPSDYLHLNFACWRLQPKDDKDYEVNLAATVAYCLEHPPWQLSLQQHKICGLP